MFWCDVLYHAGRIYEGFRGLVRMTGWLLMVGLMLAVFQMWDAKLSQNGRSANTLSTFSGVMGSIKRSFETYAPSVASNASAAARACLADEGGLVARAVGYDAPVGNGDCGTATARAAQVLPAASIGTVRNGWAALQPAMPAGRLLPRTQALAPIQVPQPPSGGPAWFGGGR